MTNTLRIRRRAVGGAAGAPSSLLNAELAYNEQDNTLYYGFGISTGSTAASIIPIAGSGAYMTLGTTQTIAGAKTFTISPIVPTPATSDNSTATASTAFVKAQGYLVGNQTITLSGDATGSGTTSIAVVLAASGVTAGTYTKLTVNAKGLVTSGTSLASGDVTTALGFTPVNTAALGAANGVATLDAAGKVNMSQIPTSLLGGMNYQGTWNASTNTPSLASGTGTKGFYYKVSTAGSTLIDGLSSWIVGDLIVFDGTTWDKIDGSPTEVSSVAGRIGAVVLSTTDISGLGSMATQNAGSVNITGGTIAGSTINGNISGNAAGLTATLTVGSGGTGATSLTGLLKGNGAAAFSAAVDGTDYLSPSATIDGGTF